MSGSSSSVLGRYKLRLRGRGRRGRAFRGAAALADSPLLGPLLKEWSDVFDAEVLPLLDPTTRAGAARALRAGVPPRGAAVPQAPLRGSDRRGEAE